MHPLHTCTQDERVQAYAAHVLDLVLADDASTSSMEDAADAGVDGGVHAGTATWFGSGPATWSDSDDDSEEQR